MKNYLLENAIQRKKEAWDSFYLPSEEDINKLTIGNVVKLIFIHPDWWRDERMWVEINRVWKNWDFSWILVNQPHDIKNLDYWNVIDFESENIINIYEKQ